MTLGGSLRWLIATGVCALALSATAAPAAHAERFAFAFGDDVVNDGDVCTGSCQPGHAGVAAGDLDAPAGAAVIGDEMFVPEAFANRVSVFDVRTGAFVRAFGRDVGGLDVNSCTTTCYPGLVVFCLPGHPFPCTRFDVGYLYDSIESPTGIAASGNELFIPEDQSARVSVWDAATGAFIRAFGAGVGGKGVDTCTGSACQAAFGAATAEGAFIRNPSGIAIDDGKAYVTDRAHARVSVFNANTGTFLFAFGKDVGGTGADVCTVNADCQSGTAGDGAGELDGAAGIAAGGGQVFVSEGFNNRVSVFDAATGAFVRAFGNDVGGPGADSCTTSCHAGGPGDGAGQVLIPNGVAIDGGQLAVTEALNHRVSFFDLASGAFVRAVGKDVGGSGVDSCTASCQAGSSGGGAGQLDSPANGTVAGGRLIVPDIGESRVSLLDKQTGAFLYGIGTSTHPGGGDEFERCREACQRAGTGPNRAPQGVAAAGGELFVVQTGAWRIGVFDAATGNFVRALGRDVGGAGINHCTTGCQEATTLGDGAGGELLSASSVAAAGGRLFVTDPGESRVSVLDAATGAFVRAFGGDVGGDGADVCTTSCQPGTPGDGAGELTQPVGIAVAGDEVFVADQMLQRVSVYDAATGAFLRAFGKDVGGSGIDTCTTSCQAGSSGAASGQLLSPTGIAIAGDDVFVTEGLPNNRISVFDRMTGAFERAYGKGVGGTGVDVCTTTCRAASRLATDLVGPGGLNSPAALTVSGGELYVADFANNRVSVFDAATGAFHRAFGRDVGGFGVDTCTTTCGPGNITADTSGDPFAALYGSEGPAGELLFPLGIAVAGGGVFVGDTGNGRVSVFTGAADATAPDTTIISGPAGPTNDATPAFAFNSPDGGVDFECRVDSGGFRDCASAFTTAALGDGPHVFAVRAIDAAWNYDASPATRSFVVDTAPPSTADDVPSSFTTTVTVTLTATDTGGSGVDKTYYTKGANPPAPTTASAVYDPAARPTLNPGELIYYFSTDKAGNAEAPHPSHAVPPVLSSSRTADGGAGPVSAGGTDYFRGQVLVHLHATDSGPGIAKVTCLIDGTQTRTFTPGDPGVPGAVGDHDVQFSFAFSTPGTRSYSCTAADVAANTSTATSGSFVIDNSAPVTTATTDPAGGVGRSGVTVNLSATDPSPGVGVDHIVLSTDGRSSGDVAGATAAATFTTAGAHTVSYRAVDRLGNTETLKTTTVYVDATRPGTPHVDASFVPVGPTYSGIIAGTASDNVGVAKVEVHLDDAIGRITYSHTFTATCTGCGTPGTTNVTWSVDLSGRLPARGNYLATITVTDLAGNTRTITNGAVIVQT